MGKSHKIIKKGDYFSLYVSVKNGYQEEITIKEVRLFQPTGFLPIELSKRKIAAGIDFISPIFGAYDDLIKIGVAALSRKIKEKSNLNLDTVPESVNEPVKESIVGPFITHSPKKALQANCDYREDFNLKAGGLGNRPRPDTYTISCEITYELNGKDYHKNADIEVSIFPSLQSMLLGTIVGSCLGTFVKALTDTKNQNNPAGILDLPNFTTAILLPFLSILAANIILGFIIGVTLMRKKDVQPFLTVEDFWGGVLIGFMVGYLGKGFIDRFINIGSPVGT